MHRFWVSGDYAIKTADNDLTGRNTSLERITPRDVAGFFFFPRFPDFHRSLRVISTMVDLVLGSFRDMERSLEVFRACFLRLVFLIIKLPSAEELYFFILLDWSRYLSISSL